MSPILKIFTKKSKEELIFGLISIIAGLIALATLIWVMAKYPTEEVIGERFLHDRLVFDTFIFKFHLYPITIFIIFSLIFWACGLESLRTEFSNLSSFIKTLLFIFFFIVFFISFYETATTFLFWVGKYVILSGELNMDLIQSDFEPVGHVVSFIFLSKFDTLILFISLYSLIFFYRLMNVGIHKAPEE